MRLPIEAEGVEIEEAAEIFGVGELLPRVNGIRAVIAFKMILFGDKYPKDSHV